MDKQMQQTEDFLIENEIATTEEIDLVLKINGHTLEALNDILYVRTGYRDIEQLMEAEY